MSCNYSFSLIVFMNVSMHFPSRLLLLVQRFLVWREQRFVSSLSQRVSPRLMWTAHFRETQSTSRSPVGEGNYISEELNSRSPRCLNAETLTHFHRRNLLNGTAVSCFFFYPRNSPQNSFPSRKLKWKLALKAFKHDMTAFSNTFIQNNLEFTYILVQHEPMPIHACFLSCFLVNLITRFCIIS